MEKAWAAERLPPGGHLLANGFDPNTHPDPYNILIYTSFQERAICGIIAGDEARHETFYTRMKSEVLDQDPAGGILAFRAMIRAVIAMPGRLMADGGEPDLFDRFAIVAQRLGVYTVRDYASIIQHLVAAWDIAGRRVGGAAAEAQDEVCRQAQRYERLADRRAAAIEKQPATAFSWIHDRKA